ncbi:MAG: sodium:solute symporter [Pseudomonadales bacterium]|uniref:sodium:solute symporter n=1 Tax=Halopseudomonas aestusnigri TaxID=857252 RepID=UPI000C3ABE3C|nr:sodium:solute symporter [Halopseudomonas aestusnigri]MAS65601.1 sodium:solute symporter [Pseudomonadales bacterium]MBP77082.1 sodium:solute symporter [Pseudomonadales bacterium]MCK5533012.1 sodium:solute symporter [Halopseudomonas aestusnigri]UGV29376.1 sodium:solute symporter [Halopseudomonas aestusnigri]|tara:strand:- start:8689 stop:10071 length:1383 start_codon:yes stop_codon:yes gene_type:complete
MTATSLTGLFFWGFLIAYGALMYWLSPRTVTIGGFFNGEDSQGRQASPLLLTTSIFISWIFAKSVTNAANLGAEFGLVGGLAYATYWLSIPLCGLVIYRLRRRFQATSLVSFLTSNYGRGAALAFSAAILIRLFNEVWSNTAVVGGYYGDSGSPAFIGAALLFTAVTLAYSLRGGLRSSILTDAAQAAIFVIALVWVLGLVLPNHSTAELTSTSHWALNAGVDLFLVACLQLLSYPFHDPVLTDRGFISEEKSMLRAFTLAGVLGFVAILAFSLIGVHATLGGIEAGGNVPAALAKSLGVGALIVMTLVMISAAGSTLDSTFSSLARLSGRELPALLQRDLGQKAIGVGMATMLVFALLGNLPMLAGTDILKATTISGTMVIGLAPVFLLHGFVRPTRPGFHLSFWTGIGLGIALTLGWIPQSWAIGDGRYALLLGTNLYGLILCTAGYLLPGMLTRKAV